MLPSSVHDLPRDHAFNGIDLVKFICVILVCILHIEPFPADFFGLGFLNFWLRHYICRLAVPFFFVSSGFFLFRSTGLRANADRVQSFVFKNLRLLGVWFVLLILGGDVHLWFIGSLVIAALLAYFLLKAGVPPRRIGIFSIVLFSVGLLGNSYHFLIDPLTAHLIPKVIILGYENIFGTTRNGVFFGFIFVWMGAIFANKRIVLRKAAAIAGLIVSLGLLFLEVLFLRSRGNRSTYDILFFLLPCVFFLFYIASHLHLRNRPVYARLRAIGVLVFFMHLIVEYFVKIGIKGAIKLFGVDLFVLRCPASIALTVILAVIIERLSRTKRFYWMKYLYA